MADKKLTSALVELVKEVGKDIKGIKTNYLTKSEFSNFESDVKLKYVSKTTYESDKLNFVDKSTYESEMQEIKTALTQITSV